NVVAFRKQAENVGQYLSKGSLAGVDGRLQSRSYENKEGVRVYVTEVVADSVQFLEPKGSNNGAQGQNNNSYTNAYGGQKKRPQPSQKAPEENTFANQDGSVDIQESELPFYELIRCNASHSTPLMMTAVIQPLSRVFF